MSLELGWLPEADDWRNRLKALTAAGDRAGEAAAALANLRLDFIRTNALDQAVQATLGVAEEASAGAGVVPIRLALLGSCTLRHLHGAIRVAGLRRGLAVSIYENEYGQYFQELADAGSPLHAFKPTHVLFVLDAHHVAAGFNVAMDADAVGAALDEVKARLRQCWSLAHSAFGCTIIQQTLLPVHLPLMGHNEHRSPGSRHAVVAKLNADLRAMADADGVDLLALDACAQRDGVSAWHDASLWHRAKQEISPAAAPMYGDLLVRLIAARKGRSFKCLVLDLDNTLWGGVVGDDGVDGLVLGQGSTLGEAFVAFQDYVRELSRRGVILAVCSKNDRANALEPFERHPEMVLRTSDIACFIANWDDKATNLRAIAQELNIGLDAIVFVDDNPVERNLVRRELPMVAVPEISDDPTTYPSVVAAAGYFESLSVTDDDRARTGQYQGNLQREHLKATCTDLPSYLRSLNMQLHWSRFDRLGLQRTVQLINKTNQFNLTTRRYTEEDVLALMADERAVGLQLRLVDRFGDNGVIAIVIGRLQGDEDLLIDTWLMSCRVLGRQVEPTTLNLVVHEARRLGARRIVGEFIPSKKNGMVKDHYQKLGFTLLDTRADGCSRSVLTLEGLAEAESFIEVRGPAELVSA